MRCIGEAKLTLQGLQYDRRLEEEVDECDGAFDRKDCNADDCTDISVRGVT